MCLVVAMCGVVAAHANSTVKFDIVQQSKTYVTITGTGVRMRYGPGLNYGYYKDARGNTMSPKKGERLVCIGETSDWYKVKYANGVYYIFKQYAKKVR